MTLRPAPLRAVARATEVQVFPTPVSVAVMRMNLVKVRRSRVVVRWARTRSLGMGRSTRWPPGGVSLTFHGSRTTSGGLAPVVKWYHIGLLSRQFLVRVQAGALPQTPSAVLAGSESRWPSYT